MKTILERLKALADRNRLRIVAALLHAEELCACELVELLQVSGATTSRHLGLLMHAGLLESRKAGRWIHYRLNPQADGVLVRWLSDQLKTDAGLADDRRRLAAIRSCGPEEICRRQRGAACCPE